MLASLIETCKLHGVNPDAYLSYVLTGSSAMGLPVVSWNRVVRPIPLIVTPE